MDTSSLVNLYDRLDSQKDQTKNTSSFNFGDREPDPPSQEDDLQIDDNLPATSGQTMTDVIKDKMFHNDHLFRKPEDDLPVQFRPQVVTKPIKISLSNDIIDRMKSLNQEYDNPMSRQYAYDFDNRWREKLNKHCDDYKDKFCRHILVDLYCKIIPLDHDYVCKHQHRMASDIDDFLANKKMTSYQYLTAAKENTKAPLIDFILREADRAAKQYYEACCKEMNENCKKGIKLDPKKAKDDKKSLQEATERIRKDSEVQLSVDRLAEKTKKAVKDGVEGAIVDNKDQYNKENDKQNKNDKNKSLINTSLKDQIGQTENQVKKESEEFTIDQLNEQIKNDTKKELVNEYATFIKETKDKQENKLDFKKDAVPSKEGKDLQEEMRQERKEQKIKEEQEEAMKNQKKEKQESVISLCLDYASKELITENVEMTPWLNEQLIGIAIREATLSQFDRTFGFTKDPTKNLQTKLFLNQSPLMNKETIKSLIQ